MSYYKYRAVKQDDTSFKKPRQKMWVVFHQSSSWQIVLQTNSFQEAKEKYKEILDKGGTFTSIDRIMICELVPTDSIITPNV